MSDKTWDLKCTWLWFWNQSQTLKFKDVEETICYITEEVKTKRYGKNVFKSVTIAGALYRNWRTLFGRELF